MFGWIKDKSKNIAEQYKSGLQDFVETLNSDIKVAYDNTSENIQKLTKKQNEKQEDQQEQQNQENENKDSILKNTNIKQNYDYSLITTFVQDFLPDFNEEILINVLQIVIPEIQPTDLQKDPSYNMLDRKDFTNFKVFCDYITSENLIDELIIGIDTFNSKFKETYQITDQEQLQKYKLRFFYLLIYKTNVQYKITSLQKNDSEDKQQNDQSNNQQKINNNMDNTKEEENEDDDENENNQFISKNENLNEKQETFEKIIIKNDVQQQETQQIQKQTNIIENKENNDQSLQKDIQEDKDQDDWDIDESNLEI